MKYVFALWAVLAFMLSGCAGSSLDEGSPQEPTLGEDLGGWRELAPELGSWTSGQGIFRGDAKGPNWSTLVGPEGIPNNVRLETEFTVERPARPFWSFEQDRFYGYQAGREISGYTFAAIARYVDSQRFYRIQISLQNQELAIWKPDAGYVHVAPISVTAGESHFLTVEVRGAWIEVFLDGNSVARWFDAVAPIDSGSMGLAVYDSKVCFRKVALSDLGPEIPLPYEPQPPNFRWRIWRGREWIFNRWEPVGMFERHKLILAEAKLRPGFRPVVYWELFWKQFDNTGNYSSELDSLEILKEDGPELQVAWRSQDPSKRITTTADLTVSLDQELNSYSYDVKTQFEINPGQTWEYSADGLEYLNLFPYNVVGPATAGQSNDWPWWYRWIAYSEEDGSPGKYPLSHNRLVYVSPKPDGGYFGYLGDNPINPIIFLNNPTTAALNPVAAMCNWAHDIHFRYQPYVFGQVMPEGTRHEARYRVVGYDAVRSQALFETSRLHPYFAVEERYPVYVRGINSFQESRSRAEPQAEYEWRGGDWDCQVGRDDSCSLRLTGGQPGKNRSMVDVGASHFSEPIRAGRYTLSVWVKTENIQGDGAAIGLQLLYPEEPPTYLPLRIQGTTGWQHIQLTTDLPMRDAVRILLEGGADGTVWFDDVELVYPP